MKLGGTAICTIVSAGLIGGGGAVVVGPPEVREVLLAAALLLLAARPRPRFSGMAGGAVPLFFVGSSTRANSGTHVSKRLLSETQGEFKKKKKSENIFTVKKHDMFCRLRSCETVFEGVSMVQTLCPMDEPFLVGS